MNLSAGRVPATIEQTSPVPSLGRVGARKCFGCDGTGDVDIAASSPLWKGGLPVA